MASSASAASAPLTARPGAAGDAPRARSAFADLGPLPGPASAAGSPLCPLGTGLPPLDLARALAPPPRPEPKELESPESRRALLLASAGSTTVFLPTNPTLEQAYAGYAWFPAHPSSVADRPALARD